MKTIRFIIHKGGKGSGFHGHAGRPGEVGGSSSAGGISVRLSQVFDSSGKLLSGKHDVNEVGDLVDNGYARWTSGGAALTKAGKVAMAKELVDSGKEALKILASDQGIGYTDIGVDVSDDQLKTLGTAVEMLRGKNVRDFVKSDKFSEYFDLDALETFIVGDQDVMQQMKRGNRVLSMAYSVLDEIFAMM